MAQIHPSHLKGNQAVSGFTHKLSELGILAERVSNDYGEDLILQTQNANIADTFTIRVQVKYANLKRNRKGLYRFQFPKDQLWRWATHADPVLICVYDSATKVFLLSEPREQFSLWYLATTKKRSLSVTFSDGDIATDDILSSLIWKLRIQYYSSLVARLEHSFLYQPISRKHEREQAEHIKGELGVLVTSFLRTVQILGEGDGFTDEFRRNVENASHNLSKKYRGEPGLRGAFMLAVLGRVHKVTGVGLPRNLIEHATELSGLYFRDYYPKEWKSFARLFTRKWQPFGLKAFKS